MKYELATYEDIKEASKTLVENWGENGEKVVATCLYEMPFNNTFDEFLKHCILRGGDWGGMLLTGIKKLYPKVWDNIPDNMGVSAWSCILNILVLLGVYIVNGKEE